MFERPHYIPRNRRANLSKYKYSGEDHSIISRYVLTPYWNRLVTFFPIGMAPNLITLTGLLFVLVNFTSLMVLAPGLACSGKPPYVSKGGTWKPFFGLNDGSLWLSSPKSMLGKVKTMMGLSDSETTCSSSWLYFSFAVGLWIYQSLDAIDGKQARRTGTSSPLGELFDHGCDALNTTLGCILASASLNLGYSWWTVASQVAALANFYLTTWEEYHTGTLYLSSFSGPVEGILLVIAVFLVTSVYGTTPPSNPPHHSYVDKGNACPMTCSAFVSGPTFWDQGILSSTGLNSFAFIKGLHLKDFRLNECSLIFACVSLTMNTIGSYMNVAKARRAYPGSNLKTLLGLLPFVLQSTLNLMWLHSQPVLLKRHLILFMVFNGLSFAYLVGLLIVSHILKSPEIFPYWNVLLILSVLGLVDSKLNMISGGYFMHPLFQSSEAGVVKFMWFSILAAAVVYGYFVADVILDVCDYCNINCLTIKDKSCDQTPRQTVQEIGSKMFNKSNKEQHSAVRKRA